MAERPRYRVGYDVDEARRALTDHGCDLKTLIYAARRVQAVRTVLVSEPGPRRRHWREMQQLERRLTVAIDKCARKR